MSFSDDAARLPGFSHVLSVFHALERTADGTRAARDYERLARLSDAELTARGLAREDLPALIFRRHFG
ncbi:MAG: hypothetical protein ACFBSD_07975 [Paracoccaceae bacterium]